MRTKEPSKEYKALLGLDNKDKIYAINIYLIVSMKFKKKRSKYNLGYANSKY
jgi:hypothetical protein